MDGVRTQFLESAWNTALVQIHAVSLLKVTYVSVICMDG